MDRREFLSKTPLLVAATPLLFSGCGKEEVRGGSFYLEALDYRSTDSGIPRLHNFHIMTDKDARYSERIVRVIGDAYKEGKLVNVDRETVIAGHEITYVFDFLPVES
ncbi:MAG: hypothetical protein HY367_03650, partial [Candidatus Aenigmarchaeota archaeon]|nr:hypothetical protein [Candidatus Aenigmarchaeota archaeon]